MTEPDRIQLIIDRFEGGQKTRFAQRIGTSKSSVTKLTDGSFRIASFAERIVRAYPEINARWLLTGEGDPTAGYPQKAEITARIESLELKMDKVFSLLGKAAK